MDRLAQTVAQNIRSSFGKSQLIKNLISLKKLLISPCQVAIPIAAGFLHH